MIRTRGLFALVLSSACIVACGGLERAIQRGKYPRWSGGIDRSAWDDGMAEKCTYEATRTIYGIERRYDAVAYSNKEHVDPVTATKSPDGKGVEVFKHHWSEVVPTEKYDYRFSTMCYVDANTLNAYKLTASTQEDCGASFKECWRDGTLYRWWESVYFPETGHRSGVIHANDYVWIDFMDSLSFTLRGANMDRMARSLHLVPSQKDTHAVSWQVEDKVLEQVGPSVQDLPIGKIEACEFRLLDAPGRVVARYWFATDATPPMLNALVRYEGPGGVTYRLKSIERTKYWER